MKLCFVFCGVRSCADINNAMNNTIASIFSCFDRENRMTGQSYPDRVIAVCRRRCRDA